MTIKCPCCKQPIYFQKLFDKINNMCVSCKEKGWVNDPIFCATIRGLPFFKRMLLLFGNESIIKKEFIKVNICRSSSVG